MTQIITAVRKPISEFPSSKVNALILQVEIDTKGLSVPLVDVPALEGSLVACYFTGQPTAGDLVLLQEVFEAHQGEDFCDHNHVVESVEESSTDVVNVWQNKVTLHAAPLSPGRYLVNWSAEICVSIGGVPKEIPPEESEVVAVKDLIRAPFVQARLQWDSQEVSATWNMTHPHHFGGGQTLDVLAGHDLTVRLDWKKMGILPGYAKIRQASLYLTKQNVA